VAPLGLGVAAAQVGAEIESAHIGWIQVEAFEQGLVDFGGVDRAAIDQYLQFIGKAALDSTRKCNFWFKVCFRFRDTTLHKVIESVVPYGGDD